MNLKTENKETLIATMLIVMSFMQGEIIKMAMKLALEKELSEWKDVLDPENLKGNDFDLLKDLEDPVINRMLYMVDINYHTMEFWTLINGVDEEQAFADEEALDLASSVLNSYLLPLDETEYRYLLHDVEMLYLSLRYLPRVAADLLMTGILEEESECFNDFWSLQYHTKLFDTLDRTDQNVDILCDLAEKVDEEYAEIGKIIRKLN